MMIHQSHWILQFPLLNDVDDFEDPLGGFHLVWLMWKPQEDKQTKWTLEIPSLPEINKNKFLNKDYVSTKTEKEIHLVNQ
jgi:hypothetical protein